MGIVHAAHDSEVSTVEAAMRLGEELAARKLVGDVYAEIRKSLYPQVCVLGMTLRPIVSNIWFWSFIIWVATFFLISIWVATCKHYTILLFHQNKTTDNLYFIISMKCDLHCIMAVLYNH